MARFGGLTALRAALGGVAGGLEGLGEQREARRLAEQQRQALERQSMMDEIMLRDKRFRPAEEMAAARQPSGEALSRALSSATAMMRPGGMAGGAAPSLQAGDTGLVQQARSLAAPRERVTMGGRAFEREEAESYRTRTAGEEAAQARMAKEQQAAETRQAREQQKRSLVGMGMSESEADAAVSMGAKFGDIYETPTQRRQARIAEANLSLSQQRLALDIARYNQSKAESDQRAASTQDKQAAAAESLRGILPTITQAQQTMDSWSDKDLKKLSAEGVNAAMVANMASTSPLGIAQAWLLNKTLVSPKDREYAQYARAISDAVARGSEVGVLTHQDIARYQSQVSFVAGDDEATKRRKFNALKSWGTWLANNQNTIVQGNRRSATQMPGESDAEFKKRTGGGQSEQNRFDQRVQRGMDSTGAASLVQRETQAANIGKAPAIRNPYRD